MSIRSLFLIRPLLVLSLLFSLLFALPHHAQGQDERGSDYTLQVNVQMVVLHATVQNSKGGPVSGITQEDFLVLENGVPQVIRYFSHEDIPVTVGLVIDNSGSMRSKRSEVISAALAFARSSNPQDQMFVVNFNQRVSYGLPEGTLFTDQVPQLEVALSRVAADGMTALYDAVGAALDRLEAGNRDKKVLIVVSDGGDNASKLRLPQIMAMARKSEAIIYTIGLFDPEDDDVDPRVLAQLSRDTGGEAFLPASAAEVPLICERIARDIRSQYTIAYVPANPKPDGTYRAIRIKAKAAGQGGLRVRTRAGYFARPAAPHTASSQGRKP